jgi:hypothetical protein
MGRAALPAWVTLVLAPSCGAQLGEPPSYLQPGPGKGDGPGAGSGGGNSSGTPIAVSRFLDGLAGRDCDEAFACQSEFPGNLGYTFEEAYGASAQICRDVTLTSWKVAAVWDGEIAAGHLGYDGAAGDACLHQMSFGDCSSFFHQGPVWSEPCYRVFMAKVAKGGACQLDYSCTGGTCDVATSTCD